ncbi:MAG: sugar phosphate nucleotidyltransferase [Promethearchaeota archaeon]|jgi:NDP-sugar pyrophosphorylase family protein
MTKGIIISGGWGTRLRPLTCTIPKSLIPVVNRPVIERQILLLKNAGVTDIILAVSVMADAVKDYFKNGEKLGVNIFYTDENIPMGTAGAIKLAEDYLKEDNFFMLNGDVILNYDFGDMINFHKENKGLGVIASKIVEDPSRYGVLIIDESTNQISKFLEKEEYQPPEGKIVPMPINAGVYLLEPEILSYIKPKKKVSIERDIFPNLSDKDTLYCYPIPGIWKDIGKPEELLEGNIQLMKDILQYSSGQESNLIDKNLDIDGKALIYPPVAIGENVTIRKNCKIGPNAVIGDNVYIDENSFIKECLIYNEAYISKDVHVEKAIISDNCLIQEGVELKGNNQNLVILASHVKVLDNIRLIAPPNCSITICHHEIVEEEIRFS